MRRFRPKNNWHNWLAKQKAEIRRELQGEGSVAQFQRKLKRDRAAEAAKKQNAVLKGAALRVVNQCRKASEGGAEIPDNLLIAIGRLEEALGLES